MTGDDLFNVYFSEYYNTSLATDDDLSEENFAAKGLSIIADYILMGSSKQKPVEIINTESQDNYYKSNAIKITSSDLHHDDYGEVLTAYENFKTAVRKTDLTKTKQDKIIGEVNKDMICTKKCLQRPIELKSAINGNEGIHWLDCDYTNPEHIRQLLRIKPRGIFSDLGVLTYDLEQALKHINLTKTELKILNAVRGYSSVTLQDIADEMNCSRQFIDRILDKITAKIIEYEKNFS